MSTREIERKWLVSGFSHSLVATESRVKRQAYLYADDNIEIRVSCDENPGPQLSNFKVTTKMGNGLNRQEVQYNINIDAFEAIARNIEQPYIRKEWECYDVGGYELCISRVDNTWFYAEIEFASEKEAEEFDADAFLPKELNAIEVTGEHMYALKNYWRRTRLGQHPTL